LFAKALQQGGWQIEAALLVHLQIVPKGLFQEIDQLKILDLSHNAIKALPEEIAALKCVKAACRLFLQLHDELLRLQRRMLDNGPK
jgi:hypothetical protein